jgi:two-component system, OmpR family, sensor kinase
MIRRLPIRLRLTLPFAVAIALVLAGMGLFVYVRVGSALLASVDNNLRTQVGEMSGHVERGTSIADRDAAGAAAIGEVIGARGAVVRTTPSHLPVLLDRARLHRVLAGERVDWNSEIHGLRGRWRILAAPVRTSHGVEAVVAAASLTARDEALDRLARELLIGGPLALLVTVAGGYLVAAAALRPVENMRARATAITASTRDRRLPVPDTGDEVARLAETLNDMLERLEAAFEHERRFVADASHELRTPLAMLRTELEIALRRPRSRQELERALHSAAEEAERLSRLAEDLLLIARGDQGRLPVRQEPLDVVDVFHDVANRYAAAASKSGRAITVCPTDTIVDADRVRLEQALGNLVSNALIYGDGTVELVARVDAEGVELHVLDGGGGFAPSFVPRAFDRFSRADDARSSGGTGLGLAIVDLIAKAHGGTAGAGNRDRRGADVWIRLPRARDGAAARRHAFTSR